MQVCISLQTDNHASTPPLSFLQVGCPSCRPTNSVKALKAKANNIHSAKIENRIEGALRPKARTWLRGLPQKHIPGRTDGYSAFRMTVWQQQRALTDVRRHLHLSATATLSLVIAHAPHTGLVAKSKYKIQALFNDLRRPKLHFSSTKITDKKPYHRRGHSKFRLQCDTEVHCTHSENSD